MDALAYRPAQAAKVLGISRSRLYQLVKDGELKGFSVGSIRLFPAVELEAWVARHATGASEELSVNNRTSTSGAA